MPAWQRDSSIWGIGNVLWLIERRRSHDFPRRDCPPFGEVLWGTMLSSATGEHRERNVPAWQARCGGVDVAAGRPKESAGLQPVIVAGKLSERFCLRSMRITWVTVYTGDMGNTFAAKWLSMFSSRPVS
jgi:hypothetical protein